MLIDRDDRARQPSQSACVDDDPLRVAVLHTDPAPGLAEALKQLRTLPVASWPSTSTS
ncbi:MAG: hypothetical protein ACR2LV_09355 [Solirubrobacteraceae bacterium]